MSTTVTTNKNIINRKIVLLKKGLSIPALAEMIGCTRQGVSKAINGKFTSVKHSSLMLTSISKALDVSIEDFWPEFFPENNNESHVDESLNAVNS